MSQLSPVTFHGDTIFCLDYQNQPYTPMRPIVENMGLDWGSQSVKLNTNAARWGVAMIATPSNGGEQEMLCLPVRKLPAYLNSINPKKVRPELRAKIELYQTESDDALWNYWMHGRAERTASTHTPADAPITPADQNVLQSIVKAKVEAIPEDRRSRGIYPQIWGRFNNHFRLSSYRQLPQCRMAEAVAYLTKLPVRESLPAPSESLDAHLAAIRTHIGGIHAHQTAIFTLGRNAIPPRPSRPGGPAPALWGASVLSLYGLEKSCAALDACLENIEMMARAVVSVAHA